MITSHKRGNLIIYKSGQWVYEDGMPISQKEKPCKRCGRVPTPEGHDACLGHVEGASSACCGHGVSEPYIMAAEMEAGG